MKKNTTYPIEIKVENGKELVATLHKEATTLDFKNPQIDFNRNDTYIQSEGINNDFGRYDSPDDLLA